MAYMSCPEELPWNGHTLLTPTTGLSSDSLLIFQLGLHYRSSLDIYVTSDVGHISRRIAEFVDHTNNPGRALWTDLHCIRIGHRHCSELGRLVLKMCIPAGVFQGLETRVDPSSFSQGPGIGLYTIWPRSRSWPWDPGGKVLVSALVSSYILARSRPWFCDPDGKASVLAASSRSRPRVYIAKFLVLRPWRQGLGLGLESILPGSWSWFRDFGAKLSVVRPWWRVFKCLEHNTRLFIWSLVCALEFVDHGNSSSVELSSESACVPGFSSEIAFVASARYFSNGNWTEQPDVVIKDVVLTGAPCTPTPPPGNQLHSTLPQAVMQSAHLAWNKIKWNK